MDFLVDLIINFTGPMPYLILFGVLLLCGLGVPIPEDITLFVAGLLSYYGITELGISIIVCFLGVMIGDSFVYWLGYHYGSRLTKKWIFHKLMPDDRLEGARIRFRERGNRLIFFARFMPGLRTPIFFSAGVLHLPFRTFFMMDGGAALLSVPTIIWLVYRGGDNIDEIVTKIKAWEHGLVAVIFASILIILAKWFITHRKLKNQESGSQK